MKDPTDMEGRRCSDNSCPLPATRVYKYTFLFPTYAYKCEEHGDALERRFTDGGQPFERLV